MTFPFHLGSLLFIKLPNGDARPVRLSALFRTKSNSDKYGLLSTPGSVRKDIESAKEKKVFLDKQFRRSAGELVHIKDILPNDATAHALFSVFRIQNATETFIPLAYTRNISDNFYHGHPTKLSRIPTVGVKSGRRQGNQHVASYGVRGCIIGDLEKSTVEVDGEEVFLSHASLARSFGKRALINEGDGGTPLISSSRALLGFVAGENAGEVLVVPAEELASRSQLTFLASSTDKALRFMPELQAAE